MKSLKSSGSRWGAALVTVATVLVAWGLRPVLSLDLLTIAFATEQYAEGVLWGRDVEIIANQLAIGAVSVQALLGDIGLLVTVLGGALMLFRGSGFARIAQLGIFLSAGSWASSAIYCLSSLPAYFVIRSAFPQAHEQFFLGPTLLFAAWLGCLIVAWYALDHTVNSPAPVGGVEQAAA